MGDRTKTPDGGALEALRRRHAEDGAARRPDDGALPPGGVLEAIRQRSRQIANGEPAQPAVPAGNDSRQTYGEGLMDFGLNGLAVGYGPRAQASAFASGMTGDFVPLADNPEWTEAYDYWLAKKNDQMDGFRSKYPWSAFGAEAVGSVAGFGALARGANGALKLAGRKPLVAATGPIGRPMQAAGLGAGFGAVYGSAQGDNVADRAVNTLAFGVASGLLGAASTPIWDGISTLARTYGLTPGQLIERVYVTRNGLSPAVISRVDEALAEFGMKLDDVPEMSGRIDEIINYGRNVDPRHAARQAMLERGGMPTDRALVTDSGRDERILDRGMEGLFGPQAEVQAKEVLKARQDSVRAGQDRLTLQAGGGREIETSPFGAANRAISGVAEAAQAARQEYKSGFDEFARSGARLSTTDPTEGASEILHTMRTAAAGSSQVNIDSMPEVAQVMRQAEGLLGAGDQRLNASIKKMAQDGSEIGRAFRAGVAQERRVVGDYVESKFGAMSATRDTGGLERRIESLADASRVELRQMMNIDAYAFSTLLERHHGARLGDIAASLGAPRTGTKSELLRRINRELAFGDNDTYALRVPESEGTMLMRAHADGARGGLVALAARERDLSASGSVADRLRDITGSGAGGADGRYSQEVIGASRAANDPARRAAREAAMQRSREWLREAGADARTPRRPGAPVDEAAAGSVDDSVAEGFAAQRASRAAREPLDARRLGEEAGYLKADASFPVLSRPEPRLKNNPVYRDWQRRRDTIMAERRARGFQEDPRTGLAIRSDVSAENVQSVLHAIDAKMRSLGGYGPGTGNSDEKAALRAMKIAVNSWLDVASVGGKQGIVAPPGAIDALRRGREGFKRYMERFRADPDSASSPHVRAASRVIDRMAHENATAEDVVGFITVGASANKTGAREFMKSLRDLLGPDSEDFAAIKQSMFASLMRRGADMKPVTTIAKDLENFFFADGQEFAREVFGDDQAFLRAIRDYTRGLRMLSRTSSHRNLSRTDISREDREAEMVQQILKTVGFAGRARAAGVSPLDVVGTGAAVGIMNAIGTHGGRSAVRNIQIGGAPSDPRSVIFPSNIAPALAQMIVEALRTPVETTGPEYP